MIKLDLIKNKMFTMIVLSICVLFANISAQDMAVPANLQAALFKKIFTFNRTLQAKGNFEVAVIGASGNDMVLAFKEAGVNAKAVIKFQQALPLFMLCRVLIRQLNSQLQKAFFLFPV